MKAYELIEKGWCQDVNARDVDGLEVDDDDAKATAWCMNGALHKVYGIDVVRFNSAYNRASTAVDNLLSKWNDAIERQQSEVIAVLKELNL